MKRVFLAVALLVPLTANAQRATENVVTSAQDAFGGVGHLAQSTVIQVGLSAQSDPFPAPTGIADIRLRLPGDETITSVSANYGPYGSSFGGEINLETPLIAGKLGTVLGVVAEQKELDFRGILYSIDYSALLHWTPTDNTEIITFFQQENGFDDERKPLIFTDGAFLRPKIDRSVFFGQDWAERTRSTQRDFGLVARSLVFGN